MRNESIEHAEDTHVRFWIKIWFENLFWKAQEVGRNTRRGRVFLSTLLACYNRLLRALQQNRAQSRLLDLLNVRKKLLSKLKIKQQLTQNDHSKCFVWIGFLTEYPALKIQIRT